MRTVHDLLPVPLAVFAAVVLAASTLRAADPAADTGDWVKISAQRCIGMAVVPNGDIFIQTDKGVRVSTDQGKTWTAVPGSGVRGRCLSDFGMSISVAYPFDGRVAFFTIDNGQSGITLDGGKTMRPLTPERSRFEFADVDWSVKDPQTVFGLTHEPSFMVLSTDGGRSCQQVSNDADDSEKRGMRYCVGVIDANTLVCSNPKQGGISMSKDAGKTWTNVAAFKVLGGRPVHYGNKVYWTTTEGVIVSTNGKEWSLTGKGPEHATFGPYFGSSDQEFMVVSPKGFFMTKDGGKVWNNVAAGFVPPDVEYQKIRTFYYFGWDPRKNILYSSGLGGSIYQLSLTK